MGIISNNIGLIHLISSLLALVFGTMVLTAEKGSKRHKRIGYYYVVAMTVLLITAFMIYQLFGKFGIFHWLAVVSSVTLFGGLIPMVLKRPSSYISLHFSFMYWSVFGLYGAFVAELMVRIPAQVIEGGRPNPMFFYMVGVAVFIVMGLANYIFYKKKSTWSAFDKSIAPNK